jgi:hypothetical protein
MKTEKGKNAVGFNKKYAQIPVEEWAEFKAHMAQVVSTLEYEANEKLTHTPAPTFGDSMVSGTWRIEYAPNDSDVWSRASESNFTTEAAALKWIGARVFTGGRCRVVPNTEYSAHR